MKDGRKRLKAHWPPTRNNSVTVYLDAADYEKVYKMAQRDGCSLADMLRKLIQEK